MGCMSPVSRTGSAKSRLCIEPSRCLCRIVIRGIVLSGLGHLFTTRVYI